MNKGFKWYNALSIDEREKVHEEFKRLYLIENKRFEVVMNLLSISSALAGHIRKTNNYIKTKEQKRQNYEEIMLEKYGVINSFQMEKSKKKAKQTKLEKYGDENYCNVEKIKETKVKHYGNGSFVNPEKAKQTKLEKYGCSNYVNTELIKSIHYNKTNAEKDAIKEKRKRTNLERYGVENCYQSEEKKEKIRNTNLKKYGFTNPFKDTEYMKRVFRDKLGVDNPFQSEEVKEKIRCTLWDKYNIFNAGELANKKRSNIEDLVFKLIPQNISVIKNDRKLLNGFEIDLLLSSLNLGFEVNGVFWHSAEHGTDKYYHQQKSLLALENGVFIRHIFEHELYDKKLHEKLVSDISLLINDTLIYDISNNEIELNLTIENPIPYMKLGYKIKTISEPQLIDGISYTVYDSGKIKLVR